MAKIRIGIMGAGYIAGVHTSVLARDERVQLAVLEHDRVDQLLAGRDVTQVGANERRHSPALFDELRGVARALDGLIVVNGDTHSLLAECHGNSASHSPSSASYKCDATGEGGHR